MCAESDECANETNACLNSTDCLLYNDCISFCDPADDLCYLFCGYDYPDGEQIFLLYATCIVCEACYADCGGAGSCL